MQQNWVRMLLGGGTVLLIGLGLFFIVRSPKEEGVVSPVSPNPTSTGTVQIPNPEPMPNPNPFPDDDDRDGLTNAEEAELGTNPHSFDTDNDSLSDIIEVRTMKTDPKKADTDGDGFSDGQEVLNGYNPLGEGSLKRP
jgi:hypothetical protein